MKLAEALALRSDLQRRVEHLRHRIELNARYQEGSTPAEDATALLAEAESTLDQLQRLVAAINRTNTQSTVSDGRSLTDALAERDVLRLHASLLQDAAAAASGAGDFRQTRSELKTVPALDVSRTRADADAVARRLRESENMIQQANWSVDLLN